MLVVSDRHSPIIASDLRIVSYRVGCAAHAKYREISLSAVPLALNIVRYRYRLCRSREIS